MTPVLVRIAFSCTKAHPPRTGYQQHEYYPQRYASNAYIAKSSASFPPFMYCALAMAHGKMCCLPLRLYSDSQHGLSLTKWPYITMRGQQLNAAITTVHCRIMTVSHLMETRWCRGYILTETRMKSYNAWYSPFIGSALEVI